MTSTLKADEAPENILDVTGVLDGENDRKAIDPALSGNDPMNIVDDGHGHHRNRTDVGDDETRLRIALEQHNAGVIDLPTLQALPGVNNDRGTPTQPSPGSAPPADPTSLLDFSFGANGQPTDPKEMCPFCRKKFSHPGSWGRHLDLKRGTRLHPAAQVDKLRGDVKRRGDPEEIRERRSQRARLYNSREDVKQRAKLRRKQKGIIDSARDMARSNFIQRLGFPSLPVDDGVKIQNSRTNENIDSSLDITDTISSKKYRSSFAYFTLFFLQSNFWPYGNDLPSEEHYNQICHVLDNTVEPLDPDTAAIYRSKLDISYHEWTTKLADHEKHLIWTICLRRILESTLGSFAAYNISTRDTWLAIEEDRLLDVMALEEQQAKYKTGKRITANSIRNSHSSSSPENLQEPQDMAVAFANAAVTGTPPL